MADEKDNVVTLAPKDPSIIGSLTEEEQKRLAFLSQKAQALTTQVGENAVRQSRLLGAFAEVENQAQQVMRDAAVRAGVPEGRQVNILPNGDIQLIPIKAPVPAPAPTEA